MIKKSEYQVNATANEKEIKTERRSRSKAKRGENVRKVTGVCAFVAEYVILGFSN